MTFLSTMKLKKGIKGTARFNKRKQLFQYQHFLLLVGQNFNLYLNVVQLLTPVLIKTSVAT